MPFVGFLRHVQSPPQASLGPTPQLYVHWPATICLPAASAERLTAAYHHTTHAAGEYSKLVNAASEVHKPTVQMRMTSRNAFFSSNALSWLILSPLQPILSDYSELPPLRVGRTAEILTTIWFSNF
jgi:hypothetical protein